MSYKNESEHTWDAIAKSFDVTRRKPWKQCIDFINKLSKTDIVADVGCGNGRHLLPCIKQCKQVIGIDISRELLYIIQEKIKQSNLKNTCLIQSSAVNIPLKDNSLDKVLFIASLHNIKRRDRRIQSLKEIKRILNKDGKALVSVWSRWQDKYRKLFFKKWFTQLGESEFGDIDIYWRQHGLNIPRFYHLYSKKEFRNDLLSADLKIIDMMEVKLHSKKHPDNYFAIVRK